MKFYWIIATLLLVNGCAPTPPGAIDPVQFLMSKAGSAYKSYKDSQVGRYQVKDSTQYASDPSIKLIQAISISDLSGVSEAINNGADINKKYDARDFSTGWRGVDVGEQLRSPIFSAIYQPNNEIVRLLVEKKPAMDKGDCIMLRREHIDVYPDSVRKGLCTVDYAVLRDANSASVFPVLYALASEEVKQKYNVLQKKLAEEKEKKRILDLQRAQEKKEKQRILAMQRAREKKEKEKKAALIKVIGKCLDNRDFYNYFPVSFKSPEESSNYYYRKAYLSTAKESFYGQTPVMEKLLGRQLNSDWSVIWLSNLEWYVKNSKFHPLFAHIMLTSFRKKNNSYHKQFSLAGFNLFIFHTKSGTLSYSNYLTNALFGVHDELNGIQNKDKRYWHGDKTLLIQAIYRRDIEQADKIIAKNKLSLTGIYRELNETQCKGWDINLSSNPLKGKILSTL